MAGRKRNSAEDIVRKLRRADELAAEGKTGEEIAAELQVSPATLYNWRRTYGGMDTDAALHCREVMAAIDALPEKQRAILLLVALEQPSYREGARALGLRVGTFRSRLSRAREQLNERLVSAAEPTPTREDANG